MDAKAIRLFVDNLELFTSCKSNKERKRIEHLVSYIYNCSLQNFGYDEAHEVLTAIFLSAKHHENVRRASGESYIIHPLEVAYKFMHLGFYDFKLTIAAILHDAIEDKTNKRERRSAEREIREKFGEEILKLVLSVTKKFFLTKSEDLADRKNYYTTVINSNDWRVQLLKIGDRDHNIETLNEMPLENQKRKLAETHTYFHIICSTLIMELSKNTETIDQKFRLIIARRIVIRFKENLNKYEHK